MPYFSAATLGGYAVAIVSTMAGGADQHVAGDDNALTRLAVVHLTTGPRDDRTISA